jgi:two-component system, OmpR family, response regulator CpxR
MRSLTQAKCGSIRSRPLWTPRAAGQLPPGRDRRALHCFVSSGPRPASEAAPRVLIVDDDRRLCELMREFLTQHGLTVSAVHDGLAGVREATTGGFDAVTLDVMLPGIDGFEVLRQVRRRADVPIIMLTARTEADDRIGGLEAGADDYLAKPIQPRELLARIRAILRRTTAVPAAPPDVIEVGPVGLSVARRQVWCHGVPVGLTAAEFDILELLLRRAGLPVSRDALTAAFHQRPASPYERGLDVHISHLRRKLRAADVDAIRTVRAVGYLFARS